MVMNLPPISSDYLESISLYYTHVTDHVITADGKFILCAIKSGFLAIFPIRKYLKDIYLLNEISTTNNPVPVANILDKLKPNALISLENSLSLHLLDTVENRSSNYRFVAGGKGTLKGHSWSIASQLENLWTIKLPSENTLTNVLEVSKDKIFAGCSDNHIYVYDAETQKELHKLSGHQDYVHCLKFTDDRVPLLYSGSEDGSIQIWDLRTPTKATNIILPFKNSALERAQYGKWIGAVDVAPNGEWLVCGGGPRLAVWHIRSNKCVHIIDTPNSVTHVAQYMPRDSSAIIHAGSGNHVGIWRMTNDAPMSDQINSSIENIYSIEHHNYDDFDYNLTSFSGDSFKLELCKNGKYIDTELFVSL